MLCAQIKKLVFFAFLLSFRMQASTSIYTGIIIGKGLRRNLAMLIHTNSANLWCISMAAINARLP